MGCSQIAKLTLVCLFLKSGHSLLSRGKVSSGKGD